MTDREIINMLLDLIAHTEPHALTDAINEAGYDHDALFPIFEEAGIEIPEEVR